MGACASDEAESVYAQDALTAIDLQLGLNGKEKDQKRAIELYEAAAAADDAVAQNNLAYCLRDDYENKSAVARAIELWTVAAAKSVDVPGVAEAQFNLGLCYETGTGVDKDDKRAKELRESAATNPRLEKNTDFPFGTMLGWILYTKHEPIPMIPDFRGKLGKQVEPIA